jgi:SAM-dependent methyltransferase
MMFAKPVVASDVGGMAEIIRDEENGFLVPAGDVAALRGAITSLLASPQRRQEFGAASRRRFESLYRKEAMVDGVNRYFDSILGRTTAEATPRPPVPETRAQPTPTGPAPRPAQPLPAATTTVVGPPAPGLSGPGPELVGRFRCPQCGAAVSVVPVTVTDGGDVKTGRLRCSGHDGVVGVIEHFKYDFLADAPSGPAPDHPLVVPEVGERRLSADGPGIERQGAWVPEGNGSLVSPGVIGDALVITAEFTDLIVRMRAQPYGGIVDIAIDGIPATTVDLYQAEGTQGLAARVASDLPLARREVAVRARGQGHHDALARTVVVEEFVLYGPSGTDTGFGPPRPINRGNPYSPYLERWLATVDAGQPVLEFGGGDRRRCQAGHLNVEYLKFELADGYADIHAIPFADDTFAATWSQAVFEHIDDPFRAAEELIRVTRPGGLVMTEVAFMQPLHAVPYHFFNMTTWGVKALFASCEILECDWFGGLSATVEWLTQAVNLPAKVDPAELAAIMERFRSYDALVSHEELRAAASAVYLVARKPG